MDWRGKSLAPKCKRPCPKCGKRTLHHEADTHYCTGCDDFTKRPEGCDFQGYVHPDGRIE